MVSISNADLVMASLRARLQRIAADKRVSRTRGTGAAERQERRGPIAEIGRLQPLPSDEFDRALVRTLLEHEFGEGMAEDPRFLRLVETTAAILAADTEIAALFRRLQDEA